MKTIIILLLTCSMAFASVSLFERVEIRLYPLKNNKVLFAKEYKKLLKEYPNNKKVVLQATILAFNMTKVEIADLIDYTYPESDKHKSVCFERGSGDFVSEKDAKSVKQTPIKTPLNPLDFIKRVPPVSPPIVIPPSATEESHFKRG